MAFEVFRNPITIYKHRLRTKLVYKLQRSIQQEIFRRWFNLNNVNEARATGGFIMWLSPGVEFTSVVSDVSGTLSKTFWKDYWDSQELPHYRSYLCNLGRIFDSLCDWKCRYYRFLDRFTVDKRFREDKKSFSFEQIWVSYKLQVPIISPTSKSKKIGTKHLSDLLNTHQIWPTEVKTSRQGKDHHHSLDKRHSNKLTEASRSQIPAIEAEVNTASL